MISTCAYCGTRFEGRPDRVMGLAQAHDRECRRRIPPARPRPVKHKARGWWNR